MKGGLTGRGQLAFSRGKKVNLMPRNKKKLNLRYPELVQALESYKQDFVIDKEIVAFRGNLTSFEKLQKRIYATPQGSSINTKVYHVFDMIFFQNLNLSSLELTERKKLLKKPSVLNSLSAFLLTEWKTGLTTLSRPAKRVGRES